MRLLHRLFGRDDQRQALALYNAVVTRARQPHWYVEGGVADDVDGRFDMIAAVLAMVLLRLEDEGQPAAALNASLAECFVDDMDGQLRQIGIGDIMVGKHIGRMMGMLGGRLGAYRDGLASGSLAGALERNLYRGHAPDAAAVEHVDRALRSLKADLGHVGLDALREGTLP